MFGWGILFPIGVIVARYFKHLDPLWFYVHTGIQSLGFILGLSGVIAGFVLDNKLEANVRKHKGLGISILTLGCLQVNSHILSLFVSYVATQIYILITVSKVHDFN